MTDDRETAGAERPAHWSQLARVWRLVGSPLRPSPEDIALVEDAVNSWPAANGAPRVLILGVTPELYRLRWPAGTDILAVDHTQGMIDAVWPGPQGAATHAQWTSIPIPNASRDIVVCDGGVNMLSYPEDQLSLVRSLRRVIAPGGLFTFRLFAPPAKREEPAVVLADMLAGNIPNLSALKLRLWTALQRDVSAGTPMKEVWNAVASVVPDLNDLAARIGWSPEHTHVLKIYRNDQSRYWFPDTLEVTRMFCEDPGGFELASIRTPSYELGDRCPTVVLRRPTM